MESFPTLSASSKAEESNIQESSKDRRSPEFFFELKDKLMEEIGVKEQSDVSMELFYVCMELRALKGINATLTKRNRNPFTKIKSTINDRSRRSDVSGFSNGDGRVFVVPSREDFVDGWSSEALKEWKKKILVILDKFEQYKPLLDMLHNVELHPDIRLLLEKYNLKDVYGLFNPDIPVAGDELQDISRHLGSAVEYRNRKIGEFLSYRYARTAPVSGSVEDFLYNAHKLIKETETEGNTRLEYRSEEIGSMIRLFPPHLIPSAMNTFEQITANEQADGRVDAQKKALKHYVLFELIHPFGDGNGRTGRALFVYLQRRYFDQLSKPLHIPIARYESGSINQEMVEAYHRVSLGSLSLDFAELFSRLAKDAALKKLSGEVYGTMYQFGVDYNMNDELVRDSIRKALVWLGDPEREKILDGMLEVARVQGARDTEESEDWKIVTGPTKEFLKQAA